MSTIQNNFSKSFCVVEHRFRLVSYISIYLENKHTLFEKSTYNCRRTCSTSRILVFNSRECFQSQSNASLQTNRQPVRTLVHVLPQFKLEKHLKSYDSNVLRGTKILVKNDFVRIKMPIYGWQSTDAIRVCHRNILRTISPHNNC